MTSAEGAIRVLYVGGEATTTGTEPPFLRTDAAESAVEGEESAVDGAAFAVEVARDAAGALDRLATDGFDCVVSEYELPDGDGVELLRTVREAHGDLPFVLYTDAGSERVASEAVAAGVTDYVPKAADAEHAAVLATRIADAVDRRRAERNYRELFRNVSAGVVVHEIETGEIVDANDRMAAILGCEREELQGASVGEFTPDDPRFTAAAARRRVRDAVADGPQTFEWLVETTDGEDVWVEVELETVAIDGRTRVLATVRDISERKRGRAEREATTRKLQGILDTVSVGIVLKDTDGRYQLMNEAARQWVGLDDGETVVGRTDEELFPPEIAAELEAADRRVIETGETIERELGLPLEGEDRTFITRRSPIFDEQGGIEAVCTVATDITARKERERERAVRSAAMETSIDGMAILDETGTYQFVNRAHADVYGYDDPDAFLGESWELCYGDEELARLEAEVLPVLEREGSWRGEAVGTRKDGSTFPQEISLTTTDDGGIVCVVRDITERRERERELQRNERRFEAVFEDPKMLVGLLDVDGTLLQANRTSMEYVDVEREAVIGEPFSAGPWWTDDVRDDVDRWVDRAATGEYVEFEVDLCRPDGEPYSVDGTIRPVTEDGEVVSLIVSARDVTERQRRERALRESEARYQSLTEDALDTSEVGTIILDASFDVVWINSAMERYFGVDREALIGRDKRDLLRGGLADVFDQPDDAVDRLLATYRDNTYTEEFECRVRAEGPDERWLKHWSQPITSGLYEGGRIEHYTDISDRKERDRQLQVLGRVLRHNFHNEMNVILGNAELIADEAPGPVGDRAETILGTGEELLELTDKQRQIVDLLSKDPGVQSVEIADQVRHSVDLLRERYPEATISTAIPDAVHGAAIPQFEQSVTELLENAVVHNDRAAPRVDVDVQVTAEAIRIRVADDGPGIPDRERAILRGEREISQLYHGRGMGLWLVHWITTNSGGTLSFEENEPRGSVVELALPRPAGDGDGVAVQSAGD